MKILALHLHNYIEYARVRGTCTDKLLQHFKGLPPDLSNETAVVSEEEFYGVLQAIHGELKDELWGIKAGHFVSLQLLGLIHRISLQTTTIAEALHYLQSYLVATLPIVKAQTNVIDTRVVVTLTIENAKTDINRVILENTLTVIAREISMMTQHPADVHLTTPFYDDHYPPEWQKSEAFTLSFEPGILKAELRQNNQLHLDVLIPQYLRMIEELRSGSSFTNRVKVTMLSMSDPELPDIQRLCNALCVTPRTLQRRLKEENISFRGLVEDLQKQICSCLLRHDRYTVSAISYVLGYSEPASFIHSFKKWFGYPPERMRERFRNA